MKKIFRLGLVSLSMAFMAACGYPSHRLGMNSGEEELKGDIKTEVMFTGAAAEHHLTLNGSVLKPENTYTYDASLTIVGDVPEKTNIEVSNGRLEITGNVGKHCNLTADLPVATHDETDIVLLPMTLPDGNGGTTTTLIPTPVTTTVIDGLLYANDQHPGIEIKGAVGDSSSIRTNAGIDVRTINKTVKYKTDFGRKVVYHRSP